MLFLNYQLSSLQFYSFCLLLVSLRFSLFPIHLSKFQLNIFYHVFVFCLSCFLGPFPIPCRQALEEEIMNHSKDLFQAVNLGQMLKTVSSVDDKEFVQSKLDTAQASYIELQERCRRKAEMLQQALANAQLFGEDEVALMNWLNEIHTRLSEVSVEDYRLEVLEKQLADQRVYTPPQATHFVALSFKLHQSCFSLFCSFVCHHRNISCYSQWLSEVCFFFSFQALQNDIGLRKKNVDQAISNGVELLKQTTGTSSFISVANSSVSVLLIIRFIALFIEQWRFAWITLFSHLWTSAEK